MFVVTVPIPMTRLAILLLALVTLPSCQRVRTMVKAKPASLSLFMEHRSEIKRQPSDAAFQYVWRTRDRQAHTQARPLTELYIAPVTTHFLRPMRTGTVRFDDRLGTQRSPAAQEMAAKLRHEFAIALANSPAPRYRLVTAPTPNSLTLEMALIELNPTQPKINAAKLVAKLMFGPLGSVGGLMVQSSGNIAIEAKIRLSRSGNLLYQFADNESDKLTLYSIRDFRPYGHVDKSISEWAGQFVDLTSQRPGTQISDASFWTLAPF